MSAELNFVRQQGLHDASAATCAYQYPALMWQPRMIGVLVLIGLILQPWWYFLALGLLLWWNAAVPTLNPFDVLHNLRGGPRLEPARGPRRFSQVMAGSFMLGIGLALYAGKHMLAWVLQGMLVGALTALILGRFCLGSYLYLLFTGRAEFARRTLPWARVE